ncbi:MAG: hypothetical protein PHY55_04240 [Bacteroidales bacterium]|nr:hypothetical protein [Bacteroidales bacterium]
MAFTGDTVKLKVHFKDFDGQVVDPVGITLKVFNERKEQIGQTINITETNKIEMGIYEYTYTLPDVDGDLILEFAGNNSGSPIVVRKSINITFV